MSWLRYEIEARIPQRYCWSLPQESHGTALTTVRLPRGDDGTTGRLFGGRLGKDDLLIEACGDVDEAVATLGIARAALADPP